MITEGKNIPVNELRKLLQSGKPSLLMEAVKRCRDEGNPGILVDLLNALKDKQVPSVRDSIVGLLNDLNEQALAPVMADYIQKHKDHPELEIIVSACWQSRLQFDQHLDVFVDILLEKDYPVALEAFTVIESFMSGAPVPHLKQQLFRLHEKLPRLDEDKSRLVSEMIRMLSVLSGPDGPQASKV